MNKVSIGVELTGVQQAAQDASALNSVLASMMGGMNSGASPSFSTGGAHRVGAPLIEPAQSNGLGEYNTPLNSHTSTQNAGALTGILGAPASSFYTGKTAPAPAPPNPYTTGGNYGPPPVLPATSAGGGNPPPGGNHPLDVRVVWSVPLSFAGGGSGTGGGTGQGGSGNGNNGGQGAGTGGSGGTGQGSGSQPSAGGGQGGGTPPSPYINNQPPTGPGWSGFKQMVMDNPTPAGLLGAGMKMIPLGPAAAITGGLAATEYGLSIYSAATAPRFQTDTSILSQQAGGQYVNPLMQDAMRRSADIQGANAGWKAAIAPLSFVTMGAAGQAYDLLAGRGLEQAAAIRQAQGSDDLIRQRVAAMTGQAPVYSHEGTQAADLRGQAARTNGFSFAKVAADVATQNFGGVGVDIWRGLTQYQAGKAAVAAADKSLDLSTKYDAAGLAATQTVMPFGAAAGSAMWTNRNAMYGSFMSNGMNFTPDVVNAGYAEASQLAMQPGMGTLYNAIRKNPGSVDKTLVGMSPQLAQLAASQGDFGGVAAMQPLLRNASGNDKLYDSMLQLAETMRTLGANLQVGQSGVSGVQSGIQALGYTGAGYRQVAGAMGGLTPLYQGQKALYQQKLVQAEKSGDIIAIAEAKAQIAAQDAAIAGVPYQQAMTVFTGRGVDNQARSIAASNQMYGAMYGGGGQGGVDKAFGSDRAAKLAQANLYADMSKSPVISPEQRALYAQQAQQMRQQATIGVDRDKSQYDYGMTEARIGVQQSQANSVSTRARMLGDASANYSADLGQIGVTSSRIAANEAYMANPKSHLSAEQRADMEKDTLALRTQNNAALLQSTRSMYDMASSVQHTQQSITAIGVSMQLALGAGGSQASGLIGQNVGEATNSLQTSQDKLNNLIKQGASPNSPEYKALVSAVAQDKAGLQNSLISYSTLPPSLDVQRQLSAANFDLQMAGKAYMPSGNRRGALDNELSGLGKSGAQMNAQYAEQTRQIALSPLSAGDKKTQQAKADADHQENQQRLALRSADAMQNLASNWMDQNIGMTINGTSRMGFVTSQFTQREAAPFMQAMGDIYNGQYGFSGKGGEAARDKNFDRFNRFQNLSMGNINTPEGFQATAMSGVTPRTVAPSAGLAHGANPAMMGGVLRPPDQHVYFHISKDAVAVTAGGNTHTVSTKGGNAVTIHAISNGAGTLVQSPHTAAGGNHQ